MGKMSQIRKTRRKFKPQPLDKKIVLQPRDVKIIRAIYQYRFLTSGQIKRLIDADGLRVVQDRLRKLYDHRYIDRPKIQINGINSPMVYGLGEQGANYLKDECDIHLGSVGRWSEKNATVKRFFLDHTIDTAEQILSFQLCCRERSDVRFLSQEEILEKTPLNSVQKGDPLAMKTTVQWNGFDEPMTVVPDGFFGLLFKSAPKEKKFAFFFLELDNATMPIVRHKFRQTSILKKMVGYASIIKHKVHYAKFGVKACRVLFVTTSWERVANMQACYRNHVSKDLGPGFFLFTTKSELAGADTLGRNAKFLTASGRAVFLDPALVSASQHSAQIPHTNS